LKALDLSWVAVTDSWEHVHHDWEVMIGEPILVESQDTSEQTAAFAVIARHRDAERQVEGVGPDVAAALTHLTHQIELQRTD
jgi:hypothetical protein